MSLPTNEEVYNAIARVLTCRDSRRGRKPALIVTIITGEDGKTVVTDHNTGCTAAIGKRAYKKRATKATVPTEKRTVRVPVNNDSLPDGQRISPITGKPVRKYVRKSAKVAGVEQKAMPFVTPPALTYKQELEKQLADAREQLSKAKLAREAIAGDPEKAKTLGIYDKVIASAQKLIIELAAKLANI